MMQSHLHTTRSAGPRAAASRGVPRGLVCRACTHCSREQGGPAQQRGAAEHGGGSEQWAARSVSERRARTAAAAVAQLLVAAQAAVAADTPVPIVPVDPSTYVPSPMEPGWQVWFGAVIGVVPFVIGAYEFTKRILIQRRCKECDGRGLVMRGKYPKKCPECGGMFPWISWRMFLSANASPGNGGPLMQPRGQTSVFYTVPPPREAGGGGGAGGAAVGQGGEAGQGPAGGAAGSGGAEAAERREAVGAQQQAPRGE